MRRVLINCGKEWKKFMRDCDVSKKSLAQLAQEMCACIMETKWNKTAEFSSV
jgi:hypothetical protein